MLSWLNELSEVTYVGVGLFLVVLIGTIDYLTGVELSFSLFYVLPLVLISWRGHIDTTIVFAALCACAWVAADHFGGKEYTSNYFHLFNSSVRLGFFLIIGILICKLQQSQQEATRQTILAQKSLSVITTSRELTTLIATNIAIHNSKLWLWLAGQKDSGKRFPNIIEETCKNIGESIAVLTEVCFGLQEKTGEEVDAEKLIDSIEDRLQAFKNEKLPGTDPGILSPIQPLQETADITAIVKTNSIEDYSILKQ